MLRQEAAAQRIIEENDEDYYQWSSKDSYFPPVNSRTILSSGPSITGPRTVGDFLTPTQQRVADKGNRWDIDHAYCRTFDPPKYAPGGLGTDLGPDPINAQHRDDILKPIPRCVNPTCLQHVSEKPTPAENIPKIPYAKEFLPGPRNSTQVIPDTEGCNRPREDKQNDSDIILTLILPKLSGSSTARESGVEPEASVGRGRDERTPAAQGDVQAACFSQPDHVIFRCQLTESKSARLSEAMSAADLRNAQPEIRFTVEEHFHREDILSEDLAMLPAAYASQRPTEWTSETLRFDLKQLLAVIFDTSNGDESTSRNPARQRSETAEYVSYRGLGHMNQETEAEYVSHSGKGPMNQETEAENASHSGKVILTQGTEAENVPHCGQVILTQETEAENVPHSGQVILTQGTEAENVSHSGQVILTQGTEAENVSHCGQVILTHATEAENVSHSGQVILTHGTEAENVSHSGQVILTHGTEAENVSHSGQVILTQGTEAENVPHSGQVILTQGTEAENVPHSGQVILTQGTESENVSHSGQVILTQGTEAENVSHSGQVILTQGTEAENVPHSGQVILTQGTEAENVPHSGQVILTQETEAENVSHSEIGILTQGTEAENVPHSGQVILTQGTEAENVPHSGHVILTQGTEAENVPHRGQVILTQGTEAENASPSGQVILTQGTEAENASPSGQVILSQGTEAENVSRSRQVILTQGTEAENASHSGQVILTQGTEAGIASGSSHGHMTQETEAENASHSGQVILTQGIEAGIASGSSQGHMTQGTEAGNASHSAQRHMAQGTDAEFNGTHTRNKRLEHTILDESPNYPFGCLLDNTFLEAVGQFGDQARPETDRQERETQNLSAETEMLVLSSDRREGLCQRASEDHQHVMSEYQRQIMDLNDQIAAERICSTFIQMQTLELMVQVTVNRTDKKIVQAYTHFMDLCEAMSKKPCTVTVREVQNTYLQLHSYMSACRSLKHQVEMTAAFLQDQILLGQKVDLSIVDVHPPDYPQLPDELFTVLGYKYDY